MKHLEYSSYVISALIRVIKPSNCDMVELTALHVISFHQALIDHHELS